MILVDFIKNSHLFLGLLQIGRKEARISTIIDPALLNKCGVLVLDGLQRLRVLILEEAEKGIFLLLLLPLGFLVQFE